MDYYSARLLYAILVDNGKPRKKNSYDESVIIFRARDFDHAFERALELGKENETTYKNCYDQTVRWALVEIMNLDWVGRKIDGKEVASHLHYRVSKNPITPKKKFKPEKSKPGQSF